MIISIIYVNIYKFLINVFQPTLNYLFLCGYVSEIALYLNNDKELVSKNFRTSKRTEIHIMLRSLNLHDFCIVFLLNDF